MCINSGRGMLRASPHLTQQPITEAVMSISIYTQTISEFCKELNPNFNTHEFWNEEMDPLYYEDAYVQSPWMKGKKHTPESIQLMRESSTGKKHSEATKKKMSESHMGQRPWNKGKTGMKHTPESIQKMSEVKKGYKHKPESIQKMRETQTGVRQTEESKRKISESLKRTFAKKKEDGIIDDRSYMKTEEYRKMQSEAQKLRYARKKLQQEKKL